MIIPSNIGTIARCSLNLYNALCEVDGVETKVVMVHKYENGFEEFDNCGYYMKGNGSFISSLVQVVGRTRWARRIKKEYQPDVTISTLSGCSTLNVKAGGDDYKIGIFHAPNTQIKGLRLQYLVSEYSYKHIYPRLDKLFCVNSGLLDFFRQNYPWINRDKVEIVYNVHPVEKIREYAKQELDSQEEKSVFADNKVMIFCGRLEFVKAPQRTVVAFGKSKLPTMGYKLVFIGGERQVSWSVLKGIASEMKIDDKVFYFGKKDNPYKYMARSAGLVSSSKSEGLPGVLIESLILHKPVVATNSSKGVWEILSCEDQYSANLNERVMMKDGIITPNTDDETLNIDQLSLALNDIVDDKYRDVDAQFIKKVSSEFIVEKYLNCTK